ncbi:hypothetical protein AB3N02_21610 [Priestia aryabhattai]|uniref:hypothetical protein n=1 Tax=Priestia aryabhattai TaxID=412384 RepID=UPI00399FB393
MAKLTNQILLGNHYINTKDGKNDAKISTLHSGNTFGVLEIENRNDGVIRIKDLELGSAKVEPEHLALLLKEVGLAQQVKEAIEKLEVAE